MSTSTFLSWNVRVNQKPDHVHDELTKIAHTYKAPDVICLQEAYKLDLNDFCNLDGLLYQGWHAKAVEGRSEASDVMLLVHKVPGITVLRHDHLMMKQHWIGPKEGQEKDPREYRGTVYRKDGQVWKVLAPHIPFGKAAVAESERAIRNYVRLTVPKRPVVVVGDMNMSAAQTREALGMKVVGHGVDQAAFKNCNVTARRLPDMHGSDHYPVLFTAVR